MGNLNCRYTAEFPICFKLLNTDLGFTNLSKAKLVLTKVTG